MPREVQLRTQCRQTDGIIRRLPLAAFAAMNVSAQDHSQRAGELQHCIFHSPVLWPFLLTPGFPWMRPPKARCPLGSPLWDLPCTLAGAHEHLSPEHPSGSSPKQVHVGFASRINQHGSPARASLLPLPRLGSHMFTCPDKRQLEAFPPSLLLACSELGGCPGTSWLCRSF